MFKVPAVVLYCTFSPGFMIFLVPSRVVRMATPVVRLAGRRLWTTAISVGADGVGIFTIHLFFVGFHAGLVPTPAPL